MGWKPARQVFRGGTEELKALYGRRVQATAPFTANQFHGHTLPAGGPIDIARGQIGFIGLPFRDWVVIALPATAPPPDMTLEKLSRFGSFRSVQVNWVSFRSNFMVAD